MPNTATEEKVDLSEFDKLITGSTPSPAANPEPTVLPTKTEDKPETKTEEKASEPTPAPTTTGVEFNPEVDDSPF